MDKIRKEIGKGSRKRVLEFFLANLGRVVWWKEVRDAAGNVEQWSRRLRELRDEFGYQILSHKDRDDLKPGQYILVNPKPALHLMPRSISKETRAWVLERNGYTCQMCGAGAGDQDPYNPGRKIQLTMGHIIDKSKGGTDDPNNLRAVCNNCNQGLQNTSPPKPDRIELLKQIRRAKVDDQIHVLRWLQRKFTKILTEENNAG